MYALLDEYKIKVPDVDRAGYASLDSTYAGLKALMEEVEAGKEEAVAKYSAGLESGGRQAGDAARSMMFIRALSWAA